MWKVSQQRNVECAVLPDFSARDFEEIREVEFHGLGNKERS
jgi:hypothetical protein